MNHPTSSQPHSASERQPAPVKVRTLPDGTRLQLRPVLPDDETLIADLMARVSTAGRRNRFHGTVNLSRAQLHAMACVDCEKEVALVVTARSSGNNAAAHGAEQVIAEARFCIDADAQGAEFALVVDDHWQRLGVGRWVMQALRDAAQAAGLTWLHGEILSSNLPMLALMRDCGLCCTPDREDDALMQAQLRLGEAAEPLAPVSRLKQHALLLRHSLAALCAQLGVWAGRRVRQRAPTHNRSGI